MIPPRSGRPFDQRQRQSRLGHDAEHAKLDEWVVSGRDRLDSRKMLPPRGNVEAICDRVGSAGRGRTAQRTEPKHLSQYRFGA